MSKSDWLLVAATFVAAFIGAALPAIGARLLGCRRHDDAPLVPGAQRLHEASDAAWVVPSNIPPPPPFEPGARPVIDKHNRPVVREPVSRRRPPDSSTWLP